MMETTDVAERGAMARGAWQNTGETAPVSSGFFRARARLDAEIERVLGTPDAADAREILTAALQVAHPKLANLLSGLRPRPTANELEVMEQIALRAGQTQSAMLVERMPGFVVSDALLHYINGRAAGSTTWGSARERLIALRTTNLLAPAIGRAQPPRRARRHRHHHAPYPTPATTNVARSHGDRQSVRY